TNIINTTGRHVQRRWFETTSTNPVVGPLQYLRYRTADLDEVVGRDRMVPGLDESAPHLPLGSGLQSWEALRLGNVAEGQLFRSLHAQKTTTLAGYRVPKDTVVVVNLNAQVFILDPNCWEESPNAFQQ
ncbi:hypothetical protein OS493_038991, partial [Desmophyllum pertusum]